MTGDDIARLIYLGLLLLFVGGGVLYVLRRGEIGRTAQQALIWIVLFGAIVFLYGQRDTLEREVFPRAARQTETGTIELRRNGGGSFVTTLEVNGQRMPFLVDTGATDVVLTLEDAQRAGFDPEELRFINTAATANGLVRTAPVTLDRVEFADRVDRDVPASVNEGALSISLLGMSYLDRFERIEILGDTLRLIDE